MLDTLSSLPHSHFLKFISTLTPLATTNLTLIQLHLRPLLDFLPALIFSSADSGLMPTVVKLFPTGDDTDEDSTVMAEEREGTILHW